MKADPEAGPGGAATTLVETLCQITGEGGAFALDGGDFTNDQIHTMYITVVFVRRYGVKARPAQLSEDRLLEAAPPAGVQRRP